MITARKKGKLSKLQKEFRKFFRGKLRGLGITKISELSKDEKSMLFKSVKKDWKKKKKELAEASVKSIEYVDSKGTHYLVSSIHKGIVELVQLENASNVFTCSAFEFKSNFKPVKAYMGDDDSPLNIAIIETSEVVATLNSLLRTVLERAPEDVRDAARIAVKASKILLQKLATEIRED